MERFHNSYANSIGHFGLQSSVMAYIRILMVFCLLQYSPSAGGQIHEQDHSQAIDADSVRREFDKGPYFTLYKDNYFIFGPSVGPKATKENTNVKFQISVRLKLTESTLPLGTYLYLCYTQKVFWNVLEKSLPMTDLNFNPGIGLAKPFFKNGKYIGKIMLQLEHESNGRDSIQSRSWNRLSLGADVLISNNLLVHAKAWVPFVDGRYNKDLLKYVGLFQVGSELSSNDRRWRGSLVFTKRKTWKLDFNTVVEISWQFSKKADWNLFAQYYNGYGEGLLDYNRFSSHLRAGIVIRPKLFSNY